MADAMTVIGKDTKISGNLQGEEDLRVLGRVEGTVQLSKTLTIDSGGAVLAEVKVRDMVVSGVMVGNVTADESVHITESGRMVGDIAAPRVIIVDGAMFRGQVDMGDIEAQRPTGTPPPRRTTPTPMPPPRPGAQRVTVKTAPAKPAPAKPAAKAPEKQPEPPPKATDLRRPPGKRPAPAPVMPVRKGKVVVKKKKG